MIGASSWVKDQLKGMASATVQWVSDVGWNAARATVNAALSGFALGLVPLGRLSSCRMRSDGIIGCFGLGSLLDRLGGSNNAVTIGNVILSREKSWNEMGAELIAHEIKHADQWAVAGLATWPNPLLGQSKMLESYLAAQALFGTCGNPFEKAAGIGPGTGVREVTCIHE